MNNNGTVNCGQLVQVVALECAFPMLDAPFNLTNTSDSIVNNHKQEQNQ